MTITHKFIAERIAAMEAEEGAFARRQQKEAESLVELCASIGHGFGPPRMTFRFNVHLGNRRGERRHCEVCGHGEWVGQEPAWGRAAADPGCT